LHFLGDWHTHPEPHPTPSGTDLESMRDCFNRSKKQVNYFIMIIVGTSTPDLSLWVSLHDEHNYHRLSQKAGSPKHT
jgi:integrative and conjugative element protein (TIGR02256 family)